MQEFLTQVERGATVEIILILINILCLLSTGIKYTLLAGKGNNKIISIN